MRRLAILALLIASVALGAPVHAAGPTAHACTATGSMTVNFQTMVASGNLVCPGATDGTVEVLALSISWNGQMKGIVGPTATCFESQSATPAAYDATIWRGTFTWTIVGPTMVLRGGLNGKLHLTPRDPTVTSACVGGVPPEMTFIFQGGLVPGVSAA